MITGRLTTGRLIIGPLDIGLLIIQLLIIGRLIIGLLIKGRFATETNDHKWQNTKASEANQRSSTTVTAQHYDRQRQGYNLIVIEVFVSSSSLL